MKLHLLGTTGYHPNDQRHTATYFLPTSSAAFDAGTGFYRLRELWNGERLDIFLTHIHLDHVVGLTFLWSVLSGRQADVRVWGLPEKLAALDRLLFATELFPARPPFRYEPLRANSPVTLADGASVSWFPLEHPGGSIGYRVDWPDRSMAYVTDTTARVDAPYVERIRGVSLLVHECYFPDGREDWARHTGHSCATPVAQVAAAAHVKRLLLVHVDPLAAGTDPIGLDSVRKTFPAAEIGVDGMCVEIEA